ncbi:MAG: DUF4838 domain-containing protein [Lentisphaeria bacterium]|nr:DUF4838 domain-containing protein [Lentisphaeria bacterium]
MKKFAFPLLTLLLAYTLSAGNVFVLKSTGFKAPGVPELLKKVLAEGEVALPPDTGKVEIYAGTVNTEPFASIFKKHLPGKKLEFDGYAVVVSGRKVYLIGNVERAVIYAANDFLEKQAGFYRRVRPVDNGTPGKKLSLKNAAWFSNPAFELRGLAGFAYKRLHPDFLDWETINNYNFRPFNMKENAFTMDELIRRGYAIKHSGHAFYYWINNDDYAKHPEYFPLIKGKRQKFEKRNYSTKVMINVGSKEVQDLVVQRMFEYMEKYPETTMISMGMNDGTGWGHSPEELAMDDPEEYKRGIYSTRYFRFCNIIAEKFCKRYPNVQIFVYAYLTAVQPPNLKKLHPNLFISLCTYRRDYKHRINDPSSSVNAYWNDLILRWKKFGNPVYIRDYILFGGSPAFDVPLLKILQQDMQYYRSIGINAYHSECIVDMPRPDASQEILSNYKGKGTANGRCRYYWHGMKMVYHLLSKILWDPYADLEQLKAEYFTKYYGPAAKYIAGIHALIAKRWEADPAPYIWNKYDTNFPQMLFAPEDMAFIEKQLKAAAAAAGKSGDKLFIERVRREEELFNNEYRKRYSAVQNTLNVVPMKGKVTFDSVKKHAIANKSVIDGLKTFERKSKTVTNSKFPAKIYCAVQGDNLIIVSDFNQKKLPVSFEKRENDNQVWKGNSTLELFISAGPDKAGDGYYQLIVTPLGNYWDAQLSHYTWNSNATFSARKSKFKWEAMAIIPLSKLGYPVNVKNFKVRMNFGRSIPDTEISSWTNGTFANESAFGILNIAR